MESFETNFASADLKNGAGMKMERRVKNCYFVNLVISFSESHFRIFAPSAPLNLLDSSTESSSKRTPVGIVPNPIRHMFLLVFLDLVPPKLVGLCMMMMFLFIVPRNMGLLSSNKYLNCKALLLLTLLQNLEKEAMFLFPRCRLAEIQRVVANCCCCQSSLIVFSCSIQFSLFGDFEEISKE